MPIPSSSTMDVEKIFHVKGGFGQTSYARNSSLQKRASDMVKHITLENIRQAYVSTAAKSFGIADLGCSSGPNTFSIIKDMVDAIEGTCRNMTSPEFRVYLNDLPTNDFNAIFKTLPELYKELGKERTRVGNNNNNKNNGGSIFIAGCPGSFYGRLFPNESLHFVYSSYSLHWLSKVPQGMYDDHGKSINGGNIYISETSPAEVTQAYYEQFQEDFSLFLKSRAEEVIGGGRMVLIFLGRSGLNHVDRGNAFLWRLLSRSLLKLIFQGEVEEEKLNSYEVPFYVPCKEEVEKEVKGEGSFEMERVEMYEVDKDVDENTTYGTTVAMTVRAIQESMLCHHFGDKILDGLFEEYGRMVDEEMTKEEIRPMTFVLVLVKRLL